MLRLYYLLCYYCSYYEICVEKVKAMRLYFKNLLAIFISATLMIFDGCNAEVTKVSYFSPYPAGSGHYILDGEELTLECAYTGTLTSLVWWTLKDGDEQILQVSPGSDQLPETEYKDRIKDSTLTSSSHQLVIRVNKQQDEGQEFRCFVATEENSFGSEKEKQLGEILVRPSSVTLGGLYSVVEGVEETIECEVTSVYRGGEVTEFGVKVGESALTSGTKTQTTGSVSGTFTVKYTQTATFTYSQHQGQQVQCEVTWMEGTSVETVRTSAMKTLDVYVPPTVVTLGIPDSLAIPEGSSVTFTCTSSSNPSPRLRLYRHREDQSASVVRSVTDVTLSWTDSVGSADNKAEFYCRVDDNRDIEGWEFDLQSVRQELTVWFQPSLSFKANTDPNPRVGDIRQLECTCSSANPHPVLTLYRGDVELKSVTGLELAHSVSVTREINGVIHKCGTGSSNPESYTYDVVSDGKYYNILFVPAELAMTGAPTDLIQENTDITAVCTTDEGNPTPTVRWYRDGQTVPVDTDLETVTEEVTGGLYNADYVVSTLRIQTDRTLNGKVYRCEVEGTSLERTFTLGVKFTATTVTLSSTHIGLVFENTEVVITCVTDESNPTAVIVWTRDGVTVKPDPSDVTTQSGQYNTQKRVSRLRVRADRTLNGAVYRCTVEGMQISQQYFMDIIFSATTIELTPSHTGLVAENKEVTFTCITDESNPISNIVWTRDDNMLSTGISVSEVSGLYNSNKRRSVLTVTTHRSLNGATYTCYVEGRESVNDSTLLKVKFPHNVQVTQSPSDSVLEDSSLTLTCEATGGNPAKVLSYSWNFIPRYEESSELIGETDRELQFVSVEYTQAGVYMCEVTNDGGVNSGSKEVLIQFLPVDVSSAVQKFTFAKINTKALLNCSVKAYPAVTSAHVNVLFEDSKISANSVVVQPVENAMDETFIQLTFDPVTAEDFGLYHFIVNNGVGEEVIIQLELIEQGVPQPPHSFMFESITAISVTLSWIPGRSGGAEQTFTVYYRHLEDSKILYNDDIHTDENNQRIVHKVSNLLSDTEYFFRIQAQNVHGESDYQPEVSAKTLDLPELKGLPEANIYYDIVVLSWAPINGNYTTLTLLKCFTGRRNCISMHNISDSSMLRHIVDTVYDTEEYYLAINQNHDEVAGQQFTIIDKTCTENCVAERNTGLVAGLAVTSTLTGLFAIALVSGILIYRWRLNKRKDPRELKSNQETRTYENVTTTSEVSHYEMTKPEEPLPPAEYTDLKQVTYELIK